MLLPELLRAGGQCAAGLDGDRAIDS